MADDTRTLFYTSAVDSLNTLQITCNTEEFTFKRKLQSLDTVLDSGVKATEAVYKKTDKTKLGKLTIEPFTKTREKDALFQGKAFILTVSTDILVFRG